MACTRRGLLRRACAEFMAQAALAMRTARAVHGVRGLHAALMVALSCVLSGSFAAAQTAEFVPIEDADGFLRATSGRALSLPADHGSHPETRTEWWYLTGVLHVDGAAPAASTPRADFGFQATWFRRALVRDVPPGRSPLATRDVMLYHGALTDVGAGALSFHEQSSRAYPPWAHAAPGTLDVALLGSSLIAVERTQATPDAPAAEGAQPARAVDRASSAPGKGFIARLRCRVGDGELDAELDFGGSEPLLHGAEPGLSLKGSEPGQASWYYSVPRLPLRGTLRRAGQPDLAVSGHAWFDHEFGSSQLAAQQVGWDWFSVALDDGSDLMLYRMRLADGSADATSSGTFRGDARAPARHLPREAFTLESTGSWTSPHSGATYPSGWTLAVPGEELVLSVQPVIADQELATPGSTGVTYWEGLCRFTGTRAGRPVQGEGYVELVGYAARFAERL